MKDEAFGIVPVFATETDSLFLLIQHQAGHWAFPKGHANPGESALETAKREFEEETGIRDCEVVEEPSFVESYSFVKEGKPSSVQHYSSAKEGESIEKTVTYFLAFVNSMEVQLQVEEVQNHAWSSFEDAVKQITFDGNRQILREVKAFLDGKKKS
ncbi:MAG: NUDIX domain-containing protein [Microcoleus sp. PH2017_29_MFU_D_A]|jgi:bis(5'-nucleosidyl)-tetraphosphatase|uniref:bis(5'-nucleosyl)-tetraphosphatase n=1 Tax=unclassified Microcoleus TaxID=2642155 RepID=UPI001D7CA1B5|nr:MULTISPECIES: NUDIX domain-containing protein [unclassified Microcoleus]MCC3419794.1 NUDIX domain-containing protein [Microcoleus sp. PH2017_07_MST_O_A]MCC3430663.1 NUDIX domain-containing protein [Microcoleus sp. PH2017_04_SCI_O_A]MCC3444080.1 NUDIX domain-containing protein [Microcoleus sp. PH2017_03_ELD_O_A]MCC3465469.1 NUDIX domain-containing protein [Microcoleus sp. PH2017_06_SFM_O_A]MCC3506564.1 NUDIX domain-containing protein [Microcoleus sp. PH2017_19_SFW_U_A]MCC3513036.1 NUDIX dom